MALEATFQALSRCLHHLQDALTTLQVTLGDKPPHDEAALADAVETVAIDLAGDLHEMRKAALHARKAVGHPLNMDGARRALSACQERFHRLERGFAVDLVSYDKLKQLARLGIERRAWLPWTNAVRQGIEECRKPLEKTSKALAACWQELVEHSGNTSISVTNTGQRIVARAPLQEEVVRERMT